MLFLTQDIVDLGIRHKDVGLIRLILLGELMIVTGRTATDFALVKTFGLTSCKAITPLTPDLHE